MIVDKDNKEFETALSLISHTNKSVFLTGKAGTGKSTFLRHVCKNVKKKHIVLAPTGIAAINVGGSTIHSVFKLPFYPLLPEDANLSLEGDKLRKFFKYNSKTIKLLSSVELIIIDEVSMVRADTIDAIDKILRSVSRKLKEPFGGKQLLLVGDVFQLEPVVKSDEREMINRYYDNPYFFSAKVFSQVQLICVELKKVYRQQEPKFISLLDRIRNNMITDADIVAVNSRYKANIGEDELCVTLTTRRDTAEHINSEKLHQIKSQQITIEGTISGDFPTASLPTQEQLTLKVGAQIIFVKNDVDKRWVNGTIGRVIDIDEKGEFIAVVTDEGNECVVERERWENTTYKYNEKKKEVEQDVVGTFIQFPIKLAWAITVHKSQGLTFSKTIIDFSGGGAFAAGQTYVALSRCTSMDGIRLNYKISRRDIFVNEEVVKFSKTFNDEMVIHQAMKETRADLKYLEALSNFKSGNYKACVENFALAVAMRNDLDKPLIRRFIQMKMSEMKHSAELKNKHTYCDIKDDDTKSAKTKHSKK